ncbi:layilin isoform X2 [Chionomys nivalis]|uniref:layilin isoform X2 n=1 Tax=Chionomys nivalis TaxID=269649 RepID=UPI0025998BEC|nr:layilin isoform X2 [Chionomys nivalis]
MQPGPALQAVLLAVLLAEPRGSKGRLLSGQLVCWGGTRRPCYKVIYFPEAFQRLNFEEAKEACRRDGGQLVSIETEDEQRLIEKFIENLLASDGDFWIGLRRLEKQGNNTACQDLYAWTDGSRSQFRNWYVDEPSCDSEVCVVMYHQPSAPPGIGGSYMFQWNDDRCNMKNNFICKYADEKPSTTPSIRPGGEATEPATPALPEETQKEDTKETFKESREAALNLAYILIPSIPLFLLLVVTSAACWIWICRRRKREQPDPTTKEQHTIWPTPHRENSPNLDVYNVIRKQSEADLAEPRPDLKNSSFRVCSGEATPDDDDVTCDYDNMAVNPSESGFMTLASMESGFVTNDIYEFSPDRMGRSKESGWVENEIYY